MIWTLNGTFLTEFKGLGEDRIKQLRLETVVDGVHVFTIPTMPEGTLELWDGPTRLAVIEGGKS